MVSFTYKSARIKTLPTVSLSTSLTTTPPAKQLRPVLWPLLGLESLVRRVWTVHMETVYKGIVQGWDRALPVYLMTNVVLGYTVEGKIPVYRK